MHDDINHCRERRNHQGAGDGQVHRRDARPRCAHLIGTELRTDACVNNEYATRLAILRFAEGIGDDNPLWTDEEYAADGPFGGIIAPPSFIFACLGSVQVGWRGLGGFHAETDDDLPPTRSGWATRSPPGVLRRLRRPDRRQQLRAAGASRTTCARSTGTRTTSWSRRFICSRMRFERTEMQARASRARSSCRTRGRTRSSSRSRRTSSPRRRAAPTPRYWEDVSGR